MTEAVLENQYADALRQQRMAQQRMAGTHSVHDTNDPNKIRSEMAAAEARKRGDPSASSGQEDEPSSLRERVMRARLLRQAQDKGVKGKMAGKAAAPAKQATSQLLKQAWINLIDSFGLTLIYINAHVFLRWVLGDTFFCKLGEEWIPKQAAAGGGEAGKTAGKGIGIVEIMALLFLDLAVLFTVIMTLTWIYLLVDIYLHPIKAVWTYGIKIIWEAIKPLFTAK